MSRIVYVNGRYAPYAEAMVHAEDRGFQLGDAVYEVCEVRHGRLVDETRHMDRLFRSLAEHLGAAIHISVTGADDHHKTEAVYKGFGRALRQAIRVEGDVVPSTKGVL
jgi:imidazoleglycerol phosphate dehydratase HisB